MEKRKLKFDKNGKFKIMVVGDTHIKFTDEVKMGDYLRMMDKFAEDLKPDLTVFMGDLISFKHYKDGKTIDATEEQKRHEMDCLVKACVDNDIPFAAVLGNHDHDLGEWQPKELFARLSEYENFICTDEAGVTGVGNCNVTVKHSNSEKDALNLWFIDSNCQSPLNDGYASVEADQIAWYEKTCDELTEKNGKVVPAFLFQHMPVVEEYHFLKETNKWDPYAVKGTVKTFKKYYKLDKSTGVKGNMGEAPCTPNISSGEFYSWKKKGDVKAAFFGHDHLNDFEGEVDGIRLLQNKSAGFHMYGDGVRQGVRLVTVDENCPEKFETKMVRYSDYFGKKCNSIKGFDLIPDRQRMVLRRAIMIITTILSIGILSYPVWKIVEKYI